MTDKELVKLGKECLDEFDYGPAYCYFLEAALMNNADACFNLGLLYLYGESVVPQQFDKAFHYLELGYELSGEDRGEPEINEVRPDIISDAIGRRSYREYIEFMLEHEEWHYYIIKGGELQGDGVYPGNVDEEIKCYEEAYKHGIEYGLDCLADLYYHGRGGIQDYKKAYELLQSTDSDSFMKNFILGEMYDYGHYVAKDSEKATEYYRKIVDSDCDWKIYDTHYEIACERLKER